LTLLSEIFSPISFISTVSLAERRVFASFRYATPLRRFQPLARYAYAAFMPSFHAADDRAAATSSDADMLTMPTPAAPRRALPMRCRGVRRAMSNRVHGD